MIERIRLKHPIWLRNPEKLNELLWQVEREMGEAWDSLDVQPGDFVRVYGFVPYHRDYNKAFNGETK